MNIRKLIKIFSISLLSVVMVLLVLLGGLYFALKSERVMKKAGEVAQEKLADSGVDVVYESASIDVLQGIRFSRLKVNIDSPDLGKAQVQIPEVSIQYDLSNILQKKIVVKEIKLSGIDIQGNFKLAPSKEEKADDEEPAEPFNLIDFLQNPPAEVTVQTIAIDLNKVNVDLEMGNQKIVWKISDLAVAASLELAESLVKYSAAVDIGNENIRSFFDFSMAAPDGAQSMQASLNLFFNLLASGSITLEGQELNIQNELAKNQFGLRDINVSLSGVQPKALPDGSEVTASSQVTVSVPEVSFSNYAAISRSGTFSENSADNIMNLLLPFTLKAGHELAVSKIALNMEETWKEKPGGSRLSLETDLKNLTDIDILINDWRDLNNWVVQALRHDINIAGVTVQMTNPEQSPLNIKVKGIGISNTGSKNQKALINNEVKIATISVPQFVKTDLALEFLNSIEFQNDLSAMTTEFKLLLNKIDLLSGDIYAQNLPQKATADLKMNIRAPATLKSLHDGAQILDQLGDLAITIENKASIEHGAASALDADWAQVKAMAINADTIVSIAQLTKPVAKPLFESSDPILVRAISNVLGSDIKSKVKLNLGKMSSFGFTLDGLDLDQEISLLNEYASAGGTIRVRNLFVPQIKDTIDVGYDNDIWLDLNLREIKFDGAAYLFKEKLLAHQIAVNNAPQNLKSELTLNIYASDASEQVSSKFADISMLGHLSVNIATEVNLEHMKDTALEITPDDVKSIAGRANTEVRISQAVKPEVKPILKNTAKEKDDQSIDEENKPALPPLAVVLNKPVKINLDAVVDGEKLDSTLKVAATDLTVHPHATINDLSVQVETKVNSINTLEKIHSSVEVDNGAVKMLQPALEGISSLLDGFGVRMKTVLTNTDKLDVDGMVIKLNDILLTKNKGSFDLKSMTGHLFSHTKITLPNEIPLEDPMTASGSISLPIKLALKEAKEISLSGGARFHDLKIKIPSKDIVVDALDGYISLKEDFKVLENNQIKLTYLEQRNPFSRVDFQMHRPVIQEANQFEFNKIQIGKISVGPMRSSISVRQNLLQVNHFDMNLLEGSATGNFELNFHPKFLSIGLLSRVTNIQPDLLTVAKAEADNKISMRTGIEYDINKSDIDGRIDVTQIGGKQLIALINFLDPDYKDEQLNSARNILNYAYPKYVGVRMNNGLLDMDIAIDSTVYGQTIEVRRVPLYAFLTSNLDEVLLKVKEIPIQ